MAREPFQYAVIRVVPRIEREEFVNVGVVLLCRPLRYLGMRVTEDLSRLVALFPEVDLHGIRTHLDELVHVVTGNPQAGPLAEMSQSERFGWMVAPSSTMIQSSGAHTGLCEDPAACLDALMIGLVSAD